jgi:hypothetical protein
MQEGSPEVHQESWLNITAIGSAIATVLLFIFSEPLFAWASQAVLKLF